MITKDEITMNTRSSYAVFLKEMLMFKLHSSQDFRKCSLLVEYLRKSWLLYSLNISISFKNTA